MLPHADQGGDGAVIALMIADARLDARRLVDCKQRSMSGCSTIESDESVSTALMVLCQSTVHTVLGSGEMLHTCAGLSSAEEHTSCLKVLCRSGATGGGGYLWLRGIWQGWHLQAATRSNYLLITSTRPHLLIDARARQ